jgi:hypothetical protein
VNEKTNEAMSERERERGMFAEIIEICNAICVRLPKRKQYFTFMSTLTLPFSLTNSFARSLTQSQSVIQSAVPTNSLKRNIDGCCVKQYSPGTIINAQIPFFIRRNVSLFR